VTEKGVVAVRLVGLAGSLRHGSYNRQLLDVVAGELPADAELTVWNGLARIPGFNEDLEAIRTPAAVAELCRALADADGLVVATPEYNHAMPGVLKNALDWASRPPGASPLAGMPAAVIGASLSAYGAVWGQQQTRAVLTAIGARVVDGEVAVPRANHAFDDQGRLVDAQLRQRLVETLDELLAAARQHAAATSSSACCAA
jgi:chromate reductase